MLNDARLPSPVPFAFSGPRFHKHHISMKPDTANVAHRNAANATLAYTAVQKLVQILGPPMSVVGAIHPANQKIAVIVSRRATAYRCAKFFLIYDTFSPPVIR